MSDIVKTMYEVQKRGFGKDSWTSLAFEEDMMEAQDIARRFRNENLVATRVLSISRRVCSHYSLSQNDIMSTISDTLTKIVDSRFAIPDGPDRDDARMIGHAFENVVSEAHELLKKIKGEYHVDQS